MSKPTRYAPCPSPRLIPTIPGVLSAAALGYTLNTCPTVPSLSSIILSPTYGRYAALELSTLMLELCFLCRLDRL